MVAMCDDDCDSEKRLRELAVQIRDHPDWKLNRCSESFEDRITRSVGAMRSGRAVEYWFEHIETSGVLRIEIPAVESSATAARGVLSQALDNRQKSNSETDPFLEQLISAHTRISEDHETKYLEPMSDAASILGVGIPFEYCGDEVDMALTGMSETSIQIQQLHDEVLAVLSDPLSP